MLKERLKVHTVLWRKVHQPFQTDQQKSGFPLMKFQEINYIKHIVLIVLWILLRQKKAISKKKKKQIQWLSLVPQTWSIGLIVQVFETTEYKAKNSSKLLQ